MSVLALVLVGAVLCFLGAYSLRASVVVAGLGVGWMLAEAFGASLGTEVLVAAGAAVLAFAATLLLARFLFFVGGACVGAVVGAKVFVLADSGAGTGHADWLLAVIFVPAIAVLAGMAANRLRHRFLRWGTAVAGAALVLSGLGRLATDRTDLLWRPDSGVASALFVLAWVVLTVVGHRVQLTTSPDRHDDAR